MVHKGEGHSFTMKYIHCMASSSMFNSCIQSSMWDTEDKHRKQWFYSVYDVVLEKSESITIEISSVQDTPGKGDLSRF